MKPLAALCLAMALLGVGCSTGADDERSEDAVAPTAVGGRALFQVEGIAGGTVPARFTCDGANDVPAVVIEEVPEDTRSLALVVDDPDAPRDQPFVHWVVYSIAPETTRITDQDPTLTYGTNDAGTTAWFGPCPPRGDAAHTYRWRLFSLSEQIDIEPGLDFPALDAQIRELVLDETDVTATYARTN